MSTTLVTVCPASYTAVIRQDGACWIGWSAEIPGVNAQESSREELLESLRDVLREALEFNRNDALEAAGPGAKELCSACETQRSASLPDGSWPRTTQEGWQSFMVAESPAKPAQLYSSSTRDQQITCSQDLQGSWASYSVVLG